MIGNDWQFAPSSRKRESPSFFLAEPEYFRSGLGAFIAIRHQPIPKMNLKSFLFFALIAILAPIAKAEKDISVYEYVNPEGALHWISLTINGEKVSGSITKYLSNDMKEKMGEEKFLGKVISGLGTENLRVEISFYSKPSSSGDVANVLVNKNGKSIWKLKPHDKLTVPMFFYIRQGYKEEAAFSYVSPN